MYYRINVSRNKTPASKFPIWEHVFATADHSLTSEYKAQQAWELLSEKFPESEGYKLSLTRWSLEGREVDPTTFEPDKETKAHMAEIKTYVLTIFNSRVNHEAPKREIEAKSPEEAKEFWFTSHWKSYLQVLSVEEKEMSSPPPKA